MTLQPVHLSTNQISCNKMINVFDIYCVIYFLIELIISTFNVLPFLKRDGIWMMLLKCQLSAVIFCASVLFQWFKKNYVNLTPKASSLFGKFPMNESGLSTLFCLKSTIWSLLGSCQGSSVVMMWCNKVQNMIWNDGDSASHRRL